MKALLILTIALFCLTNDNAVQNTKIPDCIDFQIHDPAELKLKNVKRIKEVCIKNRYLYAYEFHQVQQNPQGSYQRPSGIVYYDSICRVATVLTIGGVVGIQGTNGFTRSDFREAKVLRILYDDE